MAPAEAHAPLSGLLYKALDLYRRALGGGALMGSGPQCLVHHEGKQTLPPLESPSYSGWSKLTPEKRTVRSRRKQLVPTKKAKTPKPKTPLVKIMDSGTLCIPGQVCLLSLVLTCVACLEIEEQLCSFRARRRLRPRSCLSGKSLVFHLGCAFQVLQIRSQCQNPGNTGLSTSYKAVS